MREKKILNRELEKIEEGFVERVMRIPQRDGPPNEPSLYWLHLEIIERYHVLANANIKAGTTVMEIGCGPFAIATVPLAYLVGEHGHVLAVDVGRWTGFEDILQATTLRERVTPIECDATRLPLKPGIDMAVSIHAVRSFRDEDTIVDIFKEMFRVSSRLFVAESLPVAKTRAQKAHMEMYNLREEIIEAVSGKKDDIHYLPLEKLVKLVETAGGIVTEANPVDIKLPHYLAVIPKEYVERIKDQEKRDSLLERWEIAYQKLLNYGEEHPPVGVVKAVKR